MTNQPVETTVDPIEDAYDRIRTEPSVRGIENAAREALREGAPLHVVNQHLARRLPEGYEGFSDTPRLGLRLYALEGSRAADNFKLASLWKALVEDVGGADYSEGSKTFTEARGFYKNHLLSSYSFDQCVWTLKRVAGIKSTVSFISKSPRYVKTVVEQRSREYHDSRR